MTPENDAGYTAEQLELLRTQPADEFVAVHAERLNEWETAAERPGQDEVRLWISEALKRPDADQLGDFVNRCREYLSNVLGEC